MTTHLAILGSTATGKTDLALAIANASWLAKKFTGCDIVSLDSRQVYKEIPIISGADIPQGFSWQHPDKPGGGVGEDRYGYWQKGNTAIHGVGVVSGADEWSLAHARELVQTIMTKASYANRLVILVGGTFLYQQRVLSTDEHISVQPNTGWRAEADQMTLVELQKHLQDLSPLAWQQLNNSDKNNPRRLIRQVELILAGITPNYLLENRVSPLAADARSLADLAILLTASAEHIKAAITRRVASRMAAGAVDEVARLIHQSWFDERLPVLTATGVKEISKYLAGEISLSACQQLWQTREWQYAKQQLTWAKNYKHIQQFWVEDEIWQAKALSFVEEQLA